MYDKLDPDTIKANLPTSRLGREIIVFNSTSSTNDAAMRYAGTDIADGLVIMAQVQEKGRGRLGAKWQSRPGQSLLMSILLEKGPLKANLVSLAAAVAVAEGIGQIASHQAAIKWPNDIILDGKKVAGILIESCARANSDYYIVGIGINCHQRRQDFGEDIGPLATSIDLVARQSCQRSSIAKRVLCSAEHWFEQAVKDPEQLRLQWANLSTQLGKRVTVVYNSRRFTGNCVGVDPDQGLILQLEAGGIRMFDAAHCRIAKD